MNRSSLKRLLCLALAYCAVVACFYWIVREDWQQTPAATEGVTPSFVLEEPAKGTLIEQTFTASMDVIDSVTLTPNIWERTDGAMITLRLHKDGEILRETTVAQAAMTSNEAYVFVFSPSVSGAKGQTFTLTAALPGGMTLWAGDSIDTGRVNIAVETVGALTVSGKPVRGQLAMTVHGSNSLNATRFVLPVAAALMVLTLAAWLVSRHRARQGRKDFFARVMEMYRRYGYLLKTLVVRDFKVKYKASMLGIVWSFLNPLLITLVYYFVFNTLFRNNIENFPVYLMSGVILFNYFSEATSLGMNAIVGNAGLITKVYMPKFIYPVSKTLSSAINLTISLVPLMIIVLFSGLPLTKSMLLLPLVILFMLIFSTGVSMILASLNVFFRDTQFLWSVLITMWNFLTPIFYPESIIPARFMPVYRLNPLYQFCHFARTVVIDGVSPAPSAYLSCILACVIPLMIGVYFFRKTQDKFTLYL